MRRFLAISSTLSKRLTLPLLWGLGCCLYHLYNVAYRHVPKLHIENPALEVRFLGRKFGSIPTVTATVATDPATERLGKLGHLGRYLFGYRWQQLSIEEPNSYHPVKLHAPWHIPFQFENSRARLETEFIKPFQESLLQFRSHSLPVVIAPIPSRMAIERATLPAELPEENAFAQNKPHGREASYELYRRMIQSDPNSIVDIFSLLASYGEKHPGNSLYLPLDSHWTSLSIALTARAIIARLEETYLKKGNHDIHFERLANGLRTDPHTIGWTEQLPLFFRGNSFPLSWREPLFSLKGPKSVFRDRTIKRLVLVGSSFTARLGSLGYSLRDLLAMAIEIPIVNGINTGASAAGFKRLRNENFHFQPGDLLVWEFPWEFSMGKLNNAGELKEVIGTLF